MKSTDGIFLAQPEAPADGIPLAVKDLFDTAGLTTTYGSSIFADHVPTETAEAVRRARGGRLRERRQDEPARVRLRRHVDEPALRLGAEPGRARADRGRLERRLGGRAGRGARRRGARHRHRRLDPDPGRVLRRRRLQADLRARAARRLLAARAELRPRRPDGAHGRGLRRDDAGARAGLRAAPSRALADLARRRRVDRRGGAGVRARVEEAAALFPHASAIELPARATAPPASSCARSPRCTRRSSPSTRDAYGDDVARKLERCLAVTDAEFARGRARARALPRRGGEAARGLRPAR